MTNVTAIISMLHEGVERNSATRRFRNGPVLTWTLERLSRAERVASMAIICWEDQMEAVLPLAEAHESYVLAKGPRVSIPAIEAVSASRRWADGWRGGLLGTCAFDLGFHAEWLREVCKNLESVAAVLIDPASALVDPALIDQLIDHAAAHEDIDLCFSQAAPGLSGALVRPALLERLIAAGTTHPGRALHYMPQQPVHDPISGKACAPVPTPVARSPHRFTLDSDRQTRRIAHATVQLNGQLIGSEAEEIVHRLSEYPVADEHPREVCLELTTRRASRPIFWPGAHLDIQRPDLTSAQAESLFADLSAAEDVRLTLAGVGDPLLAPAFFDIINLAKSNGIAAIHVETDLLDVQPESIDRLADSTIDILSIHLPAVTPQTYQAVMGVDGIVRVLENVRRFIERRQKRGAGVPIVVPIFTKCRQNLGEMEAWYDQWLKAVGSAVIRGPSEFAGQIPDTGVADMSPPPRKACARLGDRITILSDGRVVSCEQDVLGKQVLGHLLEGRAPARPVGQEPDPPGSGIDRITDIWQRRMSALRLDHQGGQWNKHPLCAGCKEWHRS